MPKKVKEATDTQAEVAARRDQTLTAMFKLKPESQAEFAARLRAEREAAGGSKRGRPRKA